MFGNASSDLGWLIPGPVWGRRGREGEGERRKERGELGDERDRQREGETGREEGEREGGGLGGWEKEKGFTFFSV